MASDGAGGGRDAGRSKSGSAFQWVSVSPSPEEVASLEAAFPDVIRLPVEELEVEMVGWQQRAILARSFHRWVPAEALIREFRRAGIQGEIAPISLAFRCHIFRFEDLQACEMVLNRPWVVNGQVIGSEPWRPEFVPSEAAISSVLLWVRLPNLPMEFWKEDFLRIILAPAGQFVCVDAATLAKSRGGFARACIRVNLLHPLLPGTRVQGIHLPFWQQFAYENLEGICSRCGSMHLHGPCSQSAASGAGEDASFCAFVPWIAALRQRKEVAWSQRPERRSSQKKKAAVGVVDDAEGWSSPVKLARRRTQIAVMDGLNIRKDAGGSVVGLEVGRLARAAVPVQGERAGFPSESILQEAGSSGSVKSGYTEGGLNNQIVVHNPFASLGLVPGDGVPQETRDAFPGHLKRARPVEYQAPRLISKAEKRKGKGKALLSSKTGVGFHSPVSLSLPSVPPAGGLEVEVPCPVRVVSSSVQAVDSGGKDLGSGSLSLDQSPCADVVSVGLKADSSLHVEGAIPYLGCQFEVVMAEDQGGVPVSPSL